MNSLSDFTTDRKVIVLSCLAVAIGCAAAVAARVLLLLIALFTNLFYFGRCSFAASSPADSHLGPWMVLLPALGGLLVGLMARYGSDKIRGHGIPEAIEAILMRGSRIDGRIAVLKPVSAAISIGSGGPFGAEGPIIMTGGAIGSLVAQCLNLTSSERKTLLVAGAAAGMAAVFGTPVAGVLLAVELLLFELKPRSLTPAALAAGTAAALRPALIGAGPLFPVVPHHFETTLPLLGGCLLVGLLGGLMAALLSRAVYAVEEAFEKLPVHWMWRPALGGLAVGIGGLLFPPALGVGYDIIGQELHGTLGLSSMLGVLLVKSTIWAIALGSGTSGGVLAPVLMIGGALGGLESYFLPAQGPGFWQLLGLTAGFSGSLGCPLTAVAFAVELTHDVDSLVPLLLAASVAHALTAVICKRSILTEKIARRGFHLSREYTVDPLEILSVREVMRTDFKSYPVALLPIAPASLPSGQRLFPLLNGSGQLVGTLRKNGGNHFTPITAAPDEPMRSVVHRMASAGLTCFPVVDGSNQVLGLVSLNDALVGRRRILEAEQRRQRLLGWGRLP